MSNLEWEIRINTLLERAASLCGVLFLALLALLIPAIVLALWPV